MAAGVRGHECNRMTYVWLGLLTLVVLWVAYKVIDLCYHD